MVTLLSPFFQKKNTEYTLLKYPYVGPTTVPAVNATQLHPALQYPQMCWKLNVGIFFCLEKGT